MEFGPGSSLSLTLLTKGGDSGTQNLVVGLFNRDINVFSKDVAYDMPKSSETVNIDINTDEIKSQVPNGGILILRVSDTKRAVLLERLVFVRPP